MARAVQLQQPRVNSAAQQQAQQSAPIRASAPVQQQRPQQDARAQNSATRGNALSLIREEENGGFMPLFATASVKEVKVVAENFDDSILGLSPSEEKSSEPSTVVLRSLDPTPGIPREIGVWAPAIRTDVCRLWSVRSPGDRTNSRADDSLACCVQRRGPR